MSGRNSTANAMAGTGSTFAGIMMIIVGVWQALQGIAAIAKGDFFVVGQRYLYQFNIDTWGWIHLLIGTIMAIVGYFILSGAPWARGVGVALAMLSATANFFFIPYYPLWAIVEIALAVFVIWALLTWDARRG